MLYQLAYACDRAQAPLSRASAALHQQGHQRLSHAAEVAIAALETTANRLVWWGRPDCDR
jgi:hypothetical protein